MAKKSTGMLTTSAATPYKPTAAEVKERKRWEAEDALRTLQRAEEIKNNSALMRQVKERAREQVKTMQKVCK
jgi:hypothetical protein